MVRRLAWSDPEIIQSTGPKRPGRGRASEIVEDVAKFGARLSVSKHPGNAGTSFNLVNNVPQFAILRSDIRTNCQIGSIFQGHKSLAMWSEAFEMVSDRGFRRRDMATALYRRTVRGILYKLGAQGRADRRHAASVRR